jgi:hypothetical protein
MCLPAVVTSLAFSSNKSALRVLELQSATLVMYNMCFNSKRTLNFTHAVYLCEMGRACSTNGGEEESI